jgi:hypothetical protein
MCSLACLLYVYHATATPPSILRHQRRQRDDLRDLRDTRANGMAGALLLPAAAPPPPSRFTLSGQFMAPKKGSAIEQEIVRRPARARSSTPLASAPSAATTTTKRVVQRTRVSIQGRSSRLVQSTPQLSVHFVSQKDAPDPEDNDYYNIQEPGLLEDNIAEGRLETIRTSHKTQERRRKKYKVRYNITNHEIDGVIIHT